MVEPLPKRQMELPAVALLSLSPLASVRTAMRSAPDGVEIPQLGGGGVQAERAVAGGRERRQGQGGREDCAGVRDVGPAVVGRQGRVGDDVGDVELVGLELVGLERGEVGDADDPPRTAAEILHGLDLTWQYITGCLMRGSSTDAMSDDEALIVQTIWGRLDHDLPHAGELSLLLGAGGMPGVEI